MIRMSLSLFCLVISVDEYETENFFELEVLLLYQANKLHYVGHPHEVQLNIREQKGK